MTLARITKNKKNKAKLSDAFYVEVLIKQWPANTI